MPKITLTERAIKKIIEIMCRQPFPASGIRISVVGGGCAGFSYAMEFASPKALFLPDETLEFEGTEPKPNGKFFKLKVFIDAASMLFLDGITIDYEETLQGAGFKFDNPNAQEKCRCGQSFRA